jgi:hypothetical protein
MKRKKFLIISLFFSLLLQPNLNLFAQWKATNGPYNGAIHSVIVSNNVIIVGSSKIYKSSDNGKTWFESNNGISTSVTSIRGIVKISSNLVAGTDAGIYYSTDNGNNWTQCTGTASLNIWGMIVKSNIVFVGTSGNGVYKSTNNGLTWNAANSGITNTTIEHRCFAIRGTDIYVGSDGAGIYKSTNDGSSWTTVNTGLPGSYYAISSLAVVGTTIIAGTSGAGIYKSTNGNSWTAINNGVSATDDIMGMGVNGTTVYASTFTKTLYKSTDYINWEVVPIGVSARFEVFYLNGTDFYVGTWDKGYGLFKTKDDGATFTNFGIIQYPISVIKTSGSSILAGTYDVTGNSYCNSLFKTSDIDTVWNSNFGGFDSHNITAIESSGAVAYLFDDSGPGTSLIYRSTNNGNNWTSTGYNALYMKINKFVIAGSVVYATDNSSYSSVGVNVSTDNGQTWTSVHTGIPSSVTAVYDLVLKGTTLFIATNNGIYKNTVGQNNWTAVNSGLTNMFIKAIVVSGNNLFAGTQGGGIFKSTNDGAQWTDASNGIPLFTNITCFATSGTNVFAGSDNGVFQSVNSGSSWSNINLGLIDTTITALNVSANYLWAGTTAQGIWRRETSQLIGSVPATPGSISGTATVCQGSTNTYSVNPVSGATSYTWTLPNGWAGSSVTESIQATVNSSGTISVTANNSYGSSRLHKH